MMFAHLTAFSISFLHIFPSHVIVWDKVFCLDKSNWFTFDIPKPGGHSGGRYRSPTTKLLLTAVLLRVFRLKLLKLISRKPSTSNDFLRLLKRNLQKKRKGKELHPFFPLLLTFSTTSKYKRRRDALVIDLVVVSVTHTNACIRCIPSPFLANWIDTRFHP